MVDAGTGVFASVYGAVWDFIVFTETNERMENYVKTVGLMKGKVRARHIHTFGNFHQKSDKILR